MMCNGAHHHKNEDTVGQEKNVIEFPKLPSVRDRAILRQSLTNVLTELFTFYDDIADFVEDCAQARGNKIGIQADRTLHSWARRQLQEYRELGEARG